MQIASIGSGSKGNATLLRSADSCLLVDCGFSLAQFEKRIQRLQLDPANINAILVTHEHSDHAAGVCRLAENYRIPLYMTVGTANALKLADYRVINGGQLLQFGDLAVQVVTVPHDAAEPVQFVFTDQQTGRRFGVLTDSGHISPHMLQMYDGLHGLLLEFNYDKDMLAQGSYPPMLKQRIAGRHGHLSNEQSLQLLQRIDISALDCLIAAHISENNNSPDIVAGLLDQLELNCPPVLACQQQGFGWIQI